MNREHRLRRRALFAGAAGLAAAAALPGTASAEVADPDIDGVAEWGGRPPKGRPNELYYRPEKIVVHHTVSANTSDLSRAQAHSHARWVQDLHQLDNGWRDTGYHFIVSRGGFITEGHARSLETLQGGTSFIEAAHTAGQNFSSIGIANEGAYHDGAVPPSQQWESLVYMCAYVCEQYNLPSSQLYGHKDFGSTLCPGVIHDMLPQLRQEVESVRN